MGTRRPHQRRYPIRKDGTRRYGKVDVRGASVNGGAGCLLLFVALATAVLAIGCS